MASRKITLQQGLVMVMVTLLRARTMAQSDCTSVLITMSPCLDYVTGNTSTPTTSCCSQFANVLQSQPQCLCVVVNGGGSSLGVPINQTQALALPQLCHVKTPPPTKCKDIDDGPANSISPSGSPQGLPNNTPGGNSSTSGGSKTSAATLSAVILKMPVQFILMLLPIAFYSLSWTTIF